jgi:hypothetical protein
MPKLDAKKGALNETRQCFNLAAVLVMSDAGCWRLISQAVSSIQHKDNLWPTSLPECQNTTFPSPQISSSYSTICYARGVKQFLHWCEDRRLELYEIDPLTVAAYVEQLP